MVVAAHRRIANRVLAAVDRLNMPEASEAELLPDERNEPRSILNPLLGVPESRLKRTA
jgi:hypothetical protein